MKKRVLIIHGVESNSREHWFLEEKARLNKLGYDVAVPDMPNSFHPRKKEWVKVIEELNPDKNSILIGHSLGGTAVLRYLEKSKNRVETSILMATPIRKLGPEFKMIENFLESVFNWEKIKESSEKFVVFNQTEDPAVPLQHGKDLQRYLKAELVVVEGNDHFDRINFDLLEKYILK